MMGLKPFVLLTDQRWFEFLAGRAGGGDGTGGRLDEVNFWSPRTTRPPKKCRPGEPVFFRLKKPHHSIAGYGFFAHFTALDLQSAWACFGEKNGAAGRLEFFGLLERYRRGNPAASLGCMILRDACFWPPERWIPWGGAEGWKPNTQRGATTRDPRLASRLLAEIQRDHVETPDEFRRPEFELLEADERAFEEARQARREGQGAFRSRVLDAYGRRCAITGERTEPVLQAAHIQPYLGPRSNHIQNGLLLTQEFHTLFDLGFVTITPEYRVRVSPRLHARWQNGRRYLEYDDRELAVLPENEEARPSRAVLAWHRAHRFRGGGVVRDD